MPNLKQRRRRLSRLSVALRIDVTVTPGPSMMVTDWCMLASNLLLRQKHATRQQGFASVHSNSRADVRFARAVHRH